MCRYNKLKKYLGAEKERAAVSTQRSMFSLLLTAGRSRLRNLKPTISNQYLDVRSLQLLDEVGQEILQTSHLYPTVLRVQRSELLRRNELRYAVPESLSSVSSFQPHRSFREGHEVRVAPPSTE